MRTAQLVDDRHLHLDTALGRLRDDLFVVYPQAFERGQSPVMAETVEVGTADARAFVSTSSASATSSSPA